VLVGHSLGTFYARRFAQRFPDQVAGLVLLDPGHEDVMSFMPTAMVELSERMKPDLEQTPDLGATRTGRTS
jgi:pimeloyl-ACP methyl ester carboxylesterase